MDTLPSLYTVITLVIVLPVGGVSGGGGGVGSIFTLRALTYPVRATPPALDNKSHEPSCGVNVICVCAGIVPTTSPPGVARMVVLSMVVPVIPSPPTVFPVQRLRPASSRFGGSLPLAVVQVRLSIVGCVLLFYPSP